MVNKKQLKRQLLKLRNDLKEIKELVKELENKNGEYKEELAKAKAEYAEVCSQYQKTRSELLKAEGRIKEAEEAERIAKEQLAKANKALAKVNKENASLKQKLAKTEEQLAKAEKKGNEIDELEESIKYKINVFERAMDVLEDEIEEYGTIATEKCMAVDEFNQIIETSDNDTVIKAVRQDRLIALDEKADVERTINTKRNLLEAKGKKVRDLKITLNTISDFKEK